MHENVWKKIMYAENISSSIGYAHVCKKKGLECEEQFVRYGAVQFLIETDW